MRDVCRDWDENFHAYLSPSVTSSPSSVVNEILREDRCAFHVSDMAGRPLTFRRIVQFSCNTEERRSVYKAYQEAPGYIQHVQYTPSWLYKWSNKFLLSIWYPCCRWKLMPRGYSCLLNYLRHLSTVKLRLTYRSVTLYGIKLRPGSERNRSPFFTRSSRRTKAWSHLLVSVPWSALDKS